MSKRIYLDYASLTPIDKRVLKVMDKMSSADYANPSSWYKEGVAAREFMTSAKKFIAEFLTAHPDEIVFTSGGTESNNLAIIGAVEALHEKGVEYADMHALTSVIEHSSVRECFNHLSDLGVKIDVVGVGSDGIVDLETVKKLLTPKTVIVSIMTVNNEIGSVQPVREIAKVIRDARKNFAERPLEFEDGKKYPIFHTDASQAALFMDLNIEKLGVDLITLDAGKLYGPRGTGALFVRRGTSLIPVLYGGGQQSGLRSGTENIPGIAGMAEALKLVRIEIQKGKELSRIRELKDMFLHGLVKIRPGITVNGATDPKLSSPYILNVHIPDIDSEFFIMQMDALGVSCSTKSSCLRDEDESYVLKAIGADSKTSVRFSFGRMTKKGDVTAALNQVKKILS